eukprot:COSAG01_NODE_49377_length_372_cov_3.032967_1_plen_63_part_01
MDHDVDDPVAVTRRNQACAVGSHVARGAGPRLSEGVVGRLVDLLDAEMVGAHFRLPPEQCATV